ncbi:ASCH domain-containing protein [Nocardioides marmotae]|uniref:ASCH domain-containing protein n=1 Tax=Nocardioides marmotae TaxID=2663857 RepID=UPI0016597395|nr:ASCH domain-containing protein [Nocardioides marmotae]MBC9731705.1 ASCH domain-containing protein [Nocardioides marmotae]
MTDTASDPASDPANVLGNDLASDPEVETFWVLARRQAKLERLPAYFGPSGLVSLPPPAWSFGATPEQADELAGLVLDGVKSATASAAEDYALEGEPLPEPGTLGIVLDGGGHPRALVATTEVRVVAFEEVDEAHAHAEGEGDRTLATWRARHEAFFRDVDPHGRGFRPDMPVVLERFKVLHPKPGR